MNNFIIIENNKKFLCIKTGEFFLELKALNSLFLLHLNLIVKEKIISY